MSIKPVIYGRRATAPTRAPDGVEYRHLHVHVAKGRPSGKCTLCRATTPPADLDGIALNPRDVAALRTLVDRVELLTKFARTLLGE